MKKIFPFLLALSLCLPSALSAQEQAKASLVGVWQRLETVKDDGGTTRTIKLPVWKVYDSNGTFSSFLIANKEADCIKAMEGTYSLVNDSVYDEHITGSVTSPELVGTTNPMSYKFVSPDLLQVSYHLSGAKQGVSEGWVRIKLEMPQQSHDRIK